MDSIRLDKNKQVINLDTWDYSSYRHIADHSKRLQDVAVEGEEKLVTFPDLMPDVYGSLFKVHPELVEEVATEYSLNKSLLTEAMTTREFTELRSKTRLDEFNSALATDVISNSIVEQIPEDVADKINQMVQEQYCLVDAQNAIETLKAILAQQKNPNPKFEKALKQEQAIADTAGKKLEGLSKQVPKKVAKGRSKLRRIARNALRQASKEIEESEAMCASWGTEPGSFSKLNLGDKVKIAKRIEESKLLKEVAKLAGRFKRIAFRKQSTKISKGVSELKTIELGADIERIVPSELMFLGHPELKLDLFRRLMERNVIQYKLDSREKLGRGPMIVCIDTSGSMHGTNEYWSKAVGLALSSIAFKEKRSIVYIFFGSGRIEEKNVHEIDCNLPELAKIELAMEALTSFTSGGTNFENPLTRACKFIEQSKYNRADIVFISDGLCDVSDIFAKQFAKLKKEREFSCFGVAIDTRIGSEEKDVFMKFCDKLWHLDDLGRDEKLLNDLFSIDFT